MKNTSSKFESFSVLVLSIFLFNMALFLFLSLSQENATLFGKDVYENIGVFKAFFMGVVIMSFISGVNAIGRIFNR